MDNEPKHAILGTKTATFRSWLVPQDACPSLSEKVKTSAGWDLLHFSLLLPIWQSLLYTSLDTKVNFPHCPLRATASSAPRLVPLKSTHGFGQPHAGSYVQMHRTTPPGSPDTGRATAERSAFLPAVRGSESAEWDRPGAELRPRVPEICGASPGRERGRAGRAGQHAATSCLRARGKERCTPEGL